MNSNVLWFLVSWYDLNFVCVLVNHSRMHKYQELSKSINLLIIIDAFIAWSMQKYFSWHLFMSHVPCMTLIYVLEILGLYRSNLLISCANILIFEQHSDLTFWSQCLDLEFKCPLISWFLVWFKPCSCLSKTLKSTS